MFKGKMKRTFETEKLNLLGKDAIQNHLEVQTSFPRNWQTKALPWGNSFQKTGIIIGIPQNLR